MNNLLSYCGLVDARISASDKDLPVKLNMESMNELVAYLNKLVGWLVVNSAQLFLPSFALLFRVSQQHCLSLLVALPPIA